MPQQQENRMDQSDFHDEEKPKPDHGGSSNGFTAAMSGPLDNHDIEDPMQRQSSFYVIKRESEAKQRKSYFLLALSAFVCAVLLAIVILILYFGIHGKKDSSSVEVPAVLIDNGWAEAVMNRRTTPFDPMAEDSSCDFTGMIQPDVALQCECGDSIEIIAPDVRALYDEMRMVLIPAIYGADWTDTAHNSCDARNQALLWLSSGNNRQNASDMVQRFILAVLYYEWMGHDWDDNTWWLTERNECEWAFATCDTEDGQVVSLGFKANNMAGSIPSEISFLGHLKELSITDNHLEGTIPSELMQIASLQKLALFENKITGSVPTEIANLSNLVELRLEHNELSGSLATEIGLATSLLVLDLGFNTIGDIIPSEIGALPNLKLLNMEENRFSGTIPTHVGQLKTLESLVLNEMRLTGSIPSHLGLLGALETLQISGSGMSGTIPTELGNARSLNRLDIKDNKLEGPLPSELGQITDLYFFAANDNRLTGPIPSEFGLVTNMTHFAVFDNELTGTLPPQFAQMTHLEVLDLYETQMTGSIPLEVCGTPDLFIFVSCYDESSGSGINCPTGCCDCK